MANDESGFSYFRLRIPADLKAKIDAEAQEAGRSLNAQVLYTLQLAMEQADDLEELRNYAEDHDKRVDRLEYQMSEVLSRLGLET